MQKLSRSLADAIYLLCGVLVAALVTVIIVDVLGRNLFQVSLTSSAEIAVLLQIYVVFLATALGVPRGTHFLIFATGGLYPPRIALAAVVVVRVAIVMFSAFTGYYGLLLGLAQMSQLSASLQIPYGWFYFGLPLGALLTIVFVLCEPLRADKTGRTGLEVV